MNVHYRAGSAEPGYIAPNGSGLDPNVLYTSSNRLWRTTDGGDSWERLSGDLTRANPMTLGHSGGPIPGDMNGPEAAQPADEIPAVAPGKVDIDVIWTGSDDGLVHVTRDGGESWKNVTPPDMPGFGRVRLIDASALEGIEGEIYQVRNRSNQDPLNFPITANSRLANLLSMSERGDGRLGEGMVEVFGVMRGRLEGLLGRLEGVMREVEAFLEGELGVGEIVPDVGGGEGGVVSGGHVAGDCCLLNSAKHLDARTERMEPNRTEWSDVGSARLLVDPDLVARVVSVSGIGGRYGGSLE